jgi:hypothetical protein
MGADAVRHASVDTSRLLRVFTILTPPEKPSGTTAAQDQVELARVAVVDLQADHPAGASRDVDRRIDGPA